MMLVPFDRLHHLANALFCRLPGLVIALVPAFIFGSVARAADMELIPVRSTGSYAIVGNEITVPPGGVRVQLDVIASGWAPEPLHIAQATLKFDGSGFSGGIAGMLTFAQPSCTNPGASVECVDILGGTGGIGGCRPTMVCAPGYVDFDRPDWIFQGIGFFAGAGGGTGWNVGGLGNPANAVVADDGTRHYVGTFVLDVSPDAAGTFRVDLDPNESLLASQNGPSIPLSRSPAFITIGKAACGDGVLNQPGEECEVGLEDQCDMSVCQSDCTCEAVIPAVSEWGLVVLALLLLIGAKLPVFRPKGM